MWVYEQDPEEVRDAQKALNDFNVESLTNAIEDLIKQWQDYLDLWEKIPDTYDEYAEELAFKENQSFVTEQDLRNRNLTGLEQFKQAYFQKEKAITEITTDEIDEQIDELKDLKDEWSNLKTNIEYEQNAIYAAQLLGTSNEADLLNLRLNNMQDFVASYKNALAEVASSAAAAAASINSSWASVQAPDFNSTMTKQQKFAAAYETGTFYKQSKDVKKAILLNQGWSSAEADKIVEMIHGKTTTSLLEHYLNNYQLATSLGLTNLSLATLRKEARGFASGTKSSPAGIARTDELGYELKIPPKGQYSLLQQGTGILPNNLTERVFAMAENPALFIAKAMGSLNPYALKDSVNNSNQNTTIHIENLSLPQVDNVDQFIKELKIISGNR